MLSVHSYGLWRGGQVSQTVDVGVRLEADRKVQENGMRALRCALSDDWLGCLAYMVCATTMNGFKVTSFCLSN